MDNEEQYVAYPRAAAPSPVAVVEPLPPGVHLRAIGVAWRMFSHEWKPWVIAAFVATVLYAIVDVPYRFADNYLTYGTLEWIKAPGQSLDLTGFGEGYVLGVIPGLVSWTLLGGMASMALKQVRGQPISAWDLFSCIRFSLRFAAADFLIGIPWMIGRRLCFIPAVWIWGASSMVGYLILDQNRRTVAAIEGSFERVGLLKVGFLMGGLIVLLGIIAFAGVLALGVGFFATLPIAVITMTLHYYYFFPEAFRNDARPAV
jgi:hypothetical protein